MKEAAGTLEALDVDQDGRVGFLTEKAFKLEIPSLCYLLNGGCSESL